jgi:hypothetical protein
LELITRYSIAQRSVVFAAVLWQRKVAALDVGVDVMLADLVLFPEAADVVCDVGP